MLIANQTTFDANARDSLRSNLGMSESQIHNYVCSAHNHWNIVYGIGVGLGTCLASRVRETYGVNLLQG